MNSTYIPRVRMFAGPNGSGKTSLVYRLGKEFAPDGVCSIYRFINPDEIAQTLTIRPGLELTEAVSLQDLLDALRLGNRLPHDHPFFSEAELTGTRLYCPASACDGYVAAAVADWQREALLAAKASFTFETVMSHPSKVEFLKRARDAGYRTYVYFIATDSPGLNLERVDNRVALGGHYVPKEKLIERYHRSLQLLPATLADCTRAFIFDNSGAEPICLAEWTPDQELVVKVNLAILPAWYRRLFVLDTPKPNY